MFVLVFIVLCLLLAGLIRGRSRVGHGQEGAPGSAGMAHARGWAPNGETLVQVDRIEDRWTTLDDRQLNRLLDDSSPC